jgi:hypothetical protein
MFWLTEPAFPYDDFLVYLGVKLDRTLTYKQHLGTFKDKLKTRNNIISKLAGTSWGYKGNTENISSSLIYITAENCAPAWSRITYKKIDTQMNQTMRIISGTVKSTRTHWLSVLAHIAPTNLKIQAATCSLIFKIKANPNLLANADIFNHQAK